MRERSAVSGLISIVLILLVLVSILCRQRQQETAIADTEKRISILATLFPLAEFAAKTSGDAGTVAMLLPPGAEAHSWQPRPSDIVRLSKADLFITVGGGMEPWLDDIISSIDNDDLVILDASRDLPLIYSRSHEREHEAESEEDHASQGFDPHIWLDFENDLVIVDKITQALARLNPDRSAYFRTNADAYKQQLRDLDRRYRKAFANCRNRTLVLGGHAAFGYLARRYGLQQVALYGLSPDATPTPVQLKTVIDFCRSHRIDAIFFETFVGSDLARVIADEVGARTLVLNPGANLTQAQWQAGLTFIAIMENNLENLKNGLGCREANGFDLR